MKVYIGFGSLKLKFSLITDYLFIKFHLLINYCGRRWQTKCTDNMTDWCSQCGVLLTRLASCWTATHPRYLTLTDHSF